MPTFTLQAQDVNGDPFVTGNPINIVNQSTTELTFIDSDGILDATTTGEFVSFDGGTTLLSYEYLGSGDVRGDPLQSAAFIRVDLGGGNYATYAIDLNADGDDTPDLQDGNTKLRVRDLDEDPVDYPVPPCFVHGTLILTPEGQKPVEELAAGDRVCTRDRGVQRVRWAGFREVSGTGDFAPIEIAPGTFGNDRALRVSPQHRILLRGPHAQLHFGLSEILAPAVQLIDGSRVRRVPVARLRYHHLLFDRHEVIWSEGAPTESFHPGATVLDGDRALMAELDALFPGRFAGGADRMPTARPVARGAQARLALKVDSPLA